MSTLITNLDENTEPTGADRIAIDQSRNRDTRGFSLSSLLTWLQTTLNLTTQCTWERREIDTAGYSHNISLDMSERNIHAHFVADTASRFLTVIVPPKAQTFDGQELMVTSEGFDPGLSFRATVSAPDSSITTNPFKDMSLEFARPHYKYNLELDTWFQIGN